MSRALEKACADVNAVVAGLQIFQDHIPDTDIDGCIDDLLALAACYRELDLEHKGWERVSPRLTQDVDLSIRSLTYTLKNVRIMFGNTRHMKASGGRPYRKVWEELDYELTVVEGGLGLFARLETYSVFMQNIVGSLRGELVEPGQIVHDRESIERLLDKQLRLEGHFTGFSFAEQPEWHPPPPPMRPPMPHRNSFPFPPPPPMSATWSDGSDPYIPPAPEPPRPWGQTSPTLSSTSQQTWNTISSGGPPPTAGLSHWATRVFDGHHGSNGFRTVGGPSTCYGRPEPSTCMERLAADGFLEVLRLPLDATRVYARLFWRPSDHRARLLLSVKEVTGPAVKFCIPLTALKVIRNGPSLQLYRFDGTAEELKIWATLSFTYYEQLILFYCAFAALKSQDWKKCPDVLADRFHKRDRSEEKEEFSGEIKDDNYLHALRIYRDKDSGGIRLEARARRGAFTQTPIWTAFITEDVDDGLWVQRVGTKVCQLKGLRPYVFCQGYLPPRGKNGKFKLQFTSQTDADAFIDMINHLAV